jgi:hypothetical protein
LDRDARTGDARFAKMDVGADLDPTHQINIQRLTWPKQVEASPVGALVWCSIEPVARHRRTAPTLQQSNQGAAFRRNLSLPPQSSRRSLR